MDNICPICKKQVKETFQFPKRKDYPLFYNFQQINVTIIGWMCNDCALKKWEEELLEVNKKSFEITGKEVICSTIGDSWVHWGVYIKLLDVFEKSDEYLFDLNRKLLEMRFFTTSLSHCPYLILTETEIKNLYLGERPLYFVHQKDAIKFARLRFGQTKYSWNIISVSCVVHHHADWLDHIRKQKDD